jgi:hypothetical protein
MMERLSWIRQRPPRWRLMAREQSGSEGDGGALPFVRKTLGSFGRGARWLPRDRGQTVRDAFAGFRDWWLMELDQHPYRMLAAFLAAGFMMGLLTRRRARKEEHDEEIEASAI